MSNRRKIDLAKLARVITRPGKPPAEWPCCGSKHGNPHLPDCPFATVEASQ